MGKKKNADNLSFPKQQILDSCKLKDFPDDNFEFDENGRKFSKRLHNTVGKGEIARYQQFLIFLQCFQNSCTKDTRKQVLVWERINSFLFFMQPIQTLCTFRCLCGV